MMFVIGGMGSGRHCFVARLGLDPAWVCDVSEEDYAGSEEQRAVRADELCEQFEVLIGTEVGCGIVPMDAEERAKRERRGRLQCLIAERADRVVRMCCGIPQVIKGKPLDRVKLEGTR